MKIHILGLIASLCIGISLNAHAVKLYKWVDEEGNVTYQDQPPPETSDYEEKNINVQGTNLEKDPDFAMSTAAVTAPVVLYAVQQCESCDLMRLFLEHHKVPFTEKNVEGDPKVQDELYEMVGALRVPLLKVGDKTVDGYSRSAMAALLRSYNFPIDFPYHLLVPQIIPAPHNDIERPLVISRPSASRLTHIGLDCL